MSTSRVSSEYLLALFIRVFKLDSSVFSASSINSDSGIAHLTVFAIRLNFVGDMYLSLCLELL